MGKAGAWRERCAPIIADVIQRVGRSDTKALRKALREAYPFGERAYHPYKVWLDEIKCQLGQRQFNVRGSSIKGHGKRRCFRCGKLQDGHLLLTDTVKQPSLFDMPDKTYEVWVCYGDYSPWSPTPATSDEWIQTLEDNLFGE